MLDVQLVKREPMRALFNYIVRAHTGLTLPSSSTTKGIYIPVDYRITQIGVGSLVARFRLHCGSSPRFKYGNLHTHIVKIPENAGRVTV